MISVAVTTYNGEKYIIDQLESIYKQSLPVDEVIICDDGSQDKTVDLVRQFIDDNSLKSWILIENEVNLRYSKNFFKAISLCQGDVIFLSDQDDIWNSDKVKYMVSKIMASPDILAVSSGYIIIDSMKRKKKTIKLTESDRTLTLNEVSTNSVVKGCTMCIRKELDKMLEHNDLNLGLQLGHDWYYNFLAVLAGRNLIISEPLLYYRIHGENISLRRNQRNEALATTNLNRIKIFDEVIDSIETVLGRYERIANLDEDKKKNISSLINFTKKRREFIQGRYINLIYLLFRVNYYRKISFNWKGAMHSLISDIMYAFNINWRIK